MSVTKLEVVNDCLAVMGEAPLNAIAEAHSMKASALNVLERTDRTIQAKSWWFNIELITLSVNPVDLRIAVPNDLGTMVPVRNRPELVQRGRRLYDLSRGSDLFALGTSFQVELTRRIPLDEVPESVAYLISRSTVLAFQMEYDGDQTKTRNLMQEVQEARTAAMAEHIRNRKVNFIERSERLSRITRVINYSRRPA